MNLRQRGVIWLRAMTGHLHDQRALFVVHTVGFNNRVPAVARHCRQLAIILKNSDYFSQKARENGESLNEKVGKIFDVAIKKCIWLQLRNFPAGTLNNMWIGRHHVIRFNQGLFHKKIRRCHQNCHDFVTSFYLRTPIRNETLSHQVASRLFW